jgi:hypothetical protein
VLHATIELMKLVPYTYSSIKRTDKLIHTIRVLMEGPVLWTESSELTHPIREALEPNGIYVTGQFAQKDLHYFAVDTGKTDMGSMYDYKECEVDTDMLCWNTFHLITDKQGSLWVDIPEQHTFLKPILKAHYVEYIEWNTATKQ